MAKNYVSHRCDFKRVDRVKIRNFTEAADLHDVCKLLLLKMLRRKYKDKERYPIYTEYDLVKPLEDFPDLWMRIKGDIYVWEFQEVISKEWQKRIVKQYEDVNLIIVPLKDVDSKLRINQKLNNGNGDTLKELKAILEEYMI